MRSDFKVDVQTKLKKEECTIHAQTLQMRQRRMSSSRRSIRERWGKNQKLVGEKDAPQIA
jgi:hypothetical protein